MAKPSGGLKLGLVKGPKAIGLILARQRKRASTNLAGVNLLKSLSGLTLSAFLEVKQLQ